MKDKWMNVGYEDDELKPYLEPAPDINDTSRIRKLSYYRPYCCLASQCRDWSVLSGLAWPSLLPGSTVFE